jgi:hypothetical protein
MNMAAKTHQIDIDAAVALWLQHRNWAKVAELLPPNAKGYRWTKMGIYMAVRAARRLPQHAVRTSGSKRDLREVNLGHIWSPPLPKPMKVVPCYRTNTVHR